MTDQSLMDKSLRSVFVGNIPYEATEEKLKDIFSEVGPVLSFKLVYDRETGKPKGYGFCEYKDQETALSAMRNLNGYEIGGRTLRVDNACTEKSRMEMQNLLQGPVVENPYGEAVQADKAPEAISKAVASLPPEQMFELMKQMKLCVQNNPSEARAMLLQNPQLAYALLQAQVVMRIVDPHTAVSMLHKVNPVPTPLVPAAEKQPVPVQAPVPQPTPVPAPVTAPVPPREESWAGPPPAPVPVAVPRAVPIAPAAPAPAPTPFVAPDVDLRPVDPRLARMGDQDLRVPPGAPVPAPVVPPRDNFIPEHGPIYKYKLSVAARKLWRHRRGAAPIPVGVPRPPQPGVPSAIGPRPIGGGPTMSPISAAGGASDQEKASIYNKRNENISLPRATTMQPGLQIYGREYLQDPRGSSKQ
ncbi:Cleavage stimulation factor subunit 2 [Blattella germanica]|nr:Cleavage stimulation factor subunit 2 [Blattella germanica]